MCAGLGYPTSCTAPVALRQLHCASCTAPVALRQSFVFVAMTKSNQLKANEKNYHCFGAYSFK